MWGGHKQVQMFSDNEKAYLLQSCYYMQHIAWDAKGVVKPDKRKEESAAPTLITVCSLPALQASVSHSMHAIHSCIKAPEGQL